MLDEFTNMLFWDILHTSLLVANNPSSRIHQSFNNGYEVIPKDIIDIYIRIAEVCNDHGLPYNYLDNDENCVEMFNEMIADTNRTVDEVLEYQIPILRLFAKTLQLTHENITKDKTSTSLTPN